MFQTEKEGNGLYFSPGQIPDNDTIDKLRRAAQLQAQITARLKSGILSNHNADDSK